MQGILLLEIWIYHLGRKFKDRLVFMFINKHILFLHPKLAKQIPAGTGIRFVRRRIPDISVHIRDSSYLVRRYQALFELSFVFATKCKAVKLT